MPAPFGGSQRQITIDIDQNRLKARGLSPGDVVTSLTNSNVIIPAGTARIGDREYNVSLNSSPTVVDQFNQLPIGIKNDRNVTVTWDNWSVSSQSRAGGP